MHNYLFGLTQLSVGNF